MNQFLLSKASKQIAPYVAHGYYMAAVRGEIPLVLSREHIKNYLKARSWVQERRARANSLYGEFHNKNHEKWFENLIEEVFKFLERIVMKEGG